MKLIVPVSGSGKSGDPFRPIVPYGMTASNCKKINAIQFEIDVNEAEYKIKRLVEYLKSKSVLFPDFPVEL